MGIRPGVLALLLFLAACGNDDAGEHRVAMKGETAPGAMSSGNGPSSRWAVPGGTGRYAKGAGWYVQAPDGRMCWEVEGREPHCFDLPRKGLAHGGDPPCWSNGMENKCQTERPGTHWEPWNASGITVERAAIIKAAEREEEIYQAATRRCLDLVVNAAFGVTGPSIDADRHAQCRRLIGRLVERR